MLMTSASGRAILVLGVLAAVTIPVPIFIRDDNASALVYFVAFCLCQLLTVVAVRRLPAQTRGPWNLMLVTGALWFAGELYALFAVLNGSEAYPTPADLAYVLGYVVMAVAVLRLDRREGVGLRAGPLLDAIILTLSVGTLTLVFLIKPVMADESQTLLVRVVSSMYPLIDVMLVYLVARLLIGGRGRPRTPSVLWLAAAMLSTFVADTAMNLQSLAGDFADYPPVLNLFWLLFYLFVAFSAITAGRPDRPGVLARLLERRISGADLSVPRLAMLAIAAMLPSLVIVGRSLAEAEDPGYGQLGGGSVLLIALVIGRIWGLIKQLRMQAVQLDSLATTDPLTSIANRRSWDAELGRVLSGGAGGPGVVLVGLLDLDHFKQFNDAHGHQAGDELLRRTAEAWHRSLTPDGLVARWGGEEFAVTLRASDLQAGLARLDALRELVPQGQSASIGVAAWDGDMTSDELMRAADVALYRAKAEGRNRLVLARTGERRRSQRSRPEVSLPQGVEV